MQLACVEQGTLLSYMILQGVQRKEFICACPTAADGATAALGPVAQKVMGGAGGVAPESPFDLSEEPAAVEPFFFFHHSLGPCLLAHRMRA